MNKLIAVSLIALVAACSASDDDAAVEATPEAQAAVEETATPVVDQPTVIPVASPAELEAMRAQFAVVDMNPDTSFLTDEERGVINKLNQVGELMSEIYLRQRSEMNPVWRETIADDGGLLLELFDLHFGPWDTLDNNKPFYGDTPMPDGAAFYPADMSKEEFEQWITDHPEVEDAFRSGYTVIRRDDAGGLIAIPYSVHYREWLEPAAQLMREAAEMTSNASSEKISDAARRLVSE